MLSRQKYLVLIALLCSFSLGFPSSGDSDEASFKSEGSYINQVNIYIHCHFYKDDPACNDKRNDFDVEETGGSPDHSHDEADSDENHEEVLHTEDEVSSDPVEDIFDDDEEEDDDEDEDEDEGARIDDFDDGRSSREYWMGRIRIRDILCSVCLAMTKHQAMLDTNLAGVGRTYLEARKVKKLLVSLVITIILMV